VDQNRPQRQRYDASVRFHDLRRSHATQLLLDGVHPKIAQDP
jgi:hypothetical protein